MFETQARVGGARPKINFGRPAALVIVAAAILVGLSLAGNFVENVRRDQIMVIESWRTGQLAWYTQGGTHLQWMGKVTKYPKRGTYETKTSIRFNDGGHGTLEWSIQFEYPLDEQHLTTIHTKFGSPEAVEKALIETVSTKSVYMTGPLMSSKESYAEKRNDLIRYIEDQIDNGVYRTQQREVKVKDQLTNTDKSAVIAEIVMQENGQPARQEQAVLREFGIRSFNFAVKGLPYDEAVEAQIKQQQQITMQVQTAIAEARQAEQKTITVAQQGMAKAAEAKWEQEAIKAKLVTEGEQKLAVAALANREADQYKEMTLKRADADATYRRRIMEADGALEKKLASWVQAQQYWAAAFKDVKVPVVPNVMTGGGGGNAALNMMDIIGIKAARDLALDFGLTPSHSTGSGKSGGQ